MRPPNLATRQSLGSRNVKTVFLKKNAGTGEKIKKQEKLPPIKNVRDPFPTKIKKIKKTKQKS